MGFTKKGTDQNEWALQKRGIKMLYKKGGIKMSSTKKRGTTDQYGLYKKVDTD